MTYEVHGPGPGETVGLRSVINFNSHPASQQPAYYQPIKLLSFDFSFRLARFEEFNGNRQKSVDPQRKSRELALSEASGAGNVLTPVTL